MPARRQNSGPPHTPRRTGWQGGSGRRYEAVPESLEAFLLDDSSVYVLVEARGAGWVGGARDLIEDQVSRARFKTAVRRASNVLRFEGPGDDVQRMCLIFDLAAGQPVPCRSAA